MKQKSKYLYELVLFWCGIYQAFEEDLQQSIIDSILSEYCYYFHV